jgi:biopolymer transport protein ExbD
MIDMSFTFLIFWVAATRFENPEGLLSSQMPRDTGSGPPAVALPESPIVVRLSQLGPGPDDLRLRVDRFDNVPATIADLPDFLREVHQQPGFDQQTPVAIVADNEVRWDHVVACWNAALRAGCTKIAFAEP